MKRTTSNPLFFDNTTPENSLVPSQFVRCEVCGKLFRHITGAHLQKHGMAMKNYLKKYPNTLLSSELFKSNVSRGKQIFDDRQRKCMFCGEMFEAKYKTHKFCSKRCSMSNRWRVPESREELMKSLERTFFKPGKDNLMYGRTEELNHFYGKHHTEEAKRKIVDGRRSYDAEENPNWRGGKIERICENCGKVFLVYPYHINQRFCCRNCVLPSAIAESKRHIRLKKEALDELTSMGYQTILEKGVVIDNKTYYVDVVGINGEERVAVEVGGCTKAKLKTLNQVFDKVIHIPYQRS